MSKIRGIGELACNRRVELSLLIERSVTVRLHGETMVVRFWKEVDDSFAWLEERMDGISQRLDEFMNDGICLPFEIQGQSHLFNSQESP